MRCNANPFHERAYLMAACGRHLASDACVCVFWWGGAVRCVEWRPISVHSSHPAVSFNPHVRNLMAHIHRSSTYPRRYLPSCECVCLLVTCGQSVCVRARTSSLRHGVVVFVARAWAPFKHAWWLYIVKCLSLQYRSGVHFGRAVVGGDRGDRWLEE